MTTRILEYHPEDMTVTVEAGFLLRDLQAELKKNGQWLPIDPAFPERITIDDVISKNLSGPRRYGFGTIREHLLGLTARLANGRVIKSGGQVVKNVAGYDLHKLFVGSEGTLGTISQATFKVRPLPQTELILKGPWDAIDKVLASELSPVVLDLVPSHLIIGFAGSREEVAWQAAVARSLAIMEPGNLDYEREFWGREPTPWKHSVLPSQVIEAIKALEADAFVARAGNGVIYYRGAKKPPPLRVPDKLTARLKKMFADPAQGM